MQKHTLSLLKKYCRLDRKKKRIDIMMKRSSSQVFDEGQDDLDDEQQSKMMASSSSTLNNRRKSSWAFWKAEDGNEETTLNGNTHYSDAAKVDSAIDDQRNNTESRHINAEEKDLPKQELTSVNDRKLSWAFWPNSQVPENPLNPPDVVKSGVKKTTDVNGKSTNTKLQNHIIKKSESMVNLKKPNVILPQFEETLPLLSTHHLLFNGFKRFKKIIGYTKEADTNLYRKDEPTIFKRVLIIGVHGFFPTKMIRPLIGEPTGTSMKFAQVGETAVLQWARENHLNVEIQKIALEKEGKIFDRVDFFFDILKNSINDIRKADFIFVCSHSQGTPVSMILISKLLEYGIIDEFKKISILGMAGINIGPFYGMDKSLFIRAYATIENESLLELFQFQNFESLQSRKYIESIKNLVRHNVKITFVGSIDDQLVPLYSSIALHVQHPNLYRAVYIDGSTDSPKFLNRIIKLSCMLQNIGSTDHDVIKEISNALAGPLTGGGHSRIYNDLNVYKLALDFALKTETSSIAIEQPIKFRPFDIKKHGNGNNNPFNLPWCARGLFFEAYKKLPNGKAEIEMVFKEFDEWHPETKVLKDIKYRLNGIRAKL